MVFRQDLSFALTMEALLSSFLHLLHDTENLLRHGRPEQHGLATFLREFRLKRITPLFQRCRSLQQPPYTVSLVGLTNVGKSTLAHALLEHPVAPRRNSPATSMPVEYKHGPRWLLTLHSSAAQSVVTNTYPSAVELSGALSRYVFDENAVADGRISRIIVTGPMDLLAGDLVFADTPGFGSARPGEVATQDTSTLVEYIRDNVSEVFFCVSGESYSLLPEEKDFFEAVQHLCSTVVVTKALADETDDLDTALRKYRDLFQHIFPLCEFLFVEAKWAIAGSGKSSPERYDASRVALLRDFIKERGTAEQRLRTLRQQTARAWHDLHDLSQSELRDAQLAKIPWRADSWATFSALFERDLSVHVEAL